MSSVGSDSIVAIAQERGVHPEGGGRPVPGSLARFAGAGSLLVAQEIARLAAAAISVASRMPGGVGVWAGGSVAGPCHAWARRRRPSTARLSYGGRTAGGGLGVERRWHSHI